MASLKMIVKNESYIVRKFNYDKVDLMVYISTYLPTRTRVYDFYSYSTNELLLRTKSRKYANKFLFDYLKGRGVKIWTS